MRRNGLVGLCIIGLLTACGQHPPEPIGPPSGVRELARMQEAGTLDQGRLACSIDRLAPVLRDLQERLPMLRGNHTPFVASDLGAHARSVQSGMHASEVRDAYLAMALGAERAAAHARQRDDHSDAAVYQDYAIMLRGLTHRPETGPRFNPGQPIPWSDDEVARLVEYASLRATLAGTLDPDPVARTAVVRFERDHPALMEDYALMLLGTYRDPDLVCPATGL